MIFWAHVAMGVLIALPILLHVVLPALRQGDQHGER